MSAINIDSMWATEFNNFVVNTNKFPDMKYLITTLHEENIKVIFWATSMINVENPEYDHCVQNQYLVRDARGDVYPIKWWHGKSM